MKTDIIFLLKGWVKLMVNAKFVSRLRQEYGIEFNDLSLLDAAFTHSSYANEHREMNIQNYEKLEFLGDAVLELTISEYLYHHFPNLSEGELTRMRSNIVRTDGFSSFAETAGFKDAIALGKGEEKSGARERKTLLEDVFEAFNGALFLDRGIDAVKDFLRQTVFPVIDSGKFDAAPDYKTKFQELVQKSGSVKIEYKILNESQSEENPEFLIGLFVNNQKLSQATGKNKKIAEQNAAKIALERHNER